MNRFTWFVVGGVVALVVTGLASAAMLRGRQVVPDPSTPSGVVLMYALAEQRHDPQTAWDLLAASTQARGDRDRFLAHSSAGGIDREYLTTEDERITADDASVVLVRTYPGSGGIFGNGSSTTRSTFRLVRQDGEWRITVPSDDYLFTDKPRP
jgi:hypothetical protein